MAHYLKLGEKAEVFFDPISRLKVVKGEVEKVEKIPQTKKVLKALKNGHLEKATADEYAAYVAKTTPAEVKNNDEDVVDFNKEPDEEFLKAMTKEQLVEYAKKFGFDEDDMAELEGMKKTEMVEFILETYPNYAEE